MRHIVIKIFVLAAGLFIGLALFIIANAAFFPDKLRIDFCMHHRSSDTILGYELNKNFTDLGVIKIVVNSQGFRDREFSTSKNEDTKRILVLGDSITCAPNIADRDNIFTSKLEKLLNSSGLKAKYEVYNMGVDEYNTVQEARNLKLNGLKYKPDIVVVAYCLNDNERMNNIYYAALFNKSKINTWLMKSAVYRKIYFFVVYNMFNAENKWNNAVFADKYKSFNMLNVGFEMLSDLQKEYKFQLYVFVVPYLKDFKNYSDIGIHKKIIAELNRYPDIRTFDLLGCFSQSADDGKIFRGHNPNDFCHPNEKGHELIAGFMYDNLKKDGALD